MPTLPLLAPIRLFLLQMCIMVVVGLAAAVIVGKWVLMRLWRRKNNKKNAVDASSAVDDCDPEAGNNSSIIEPADCDCDVESGRDDLASAEDDMESGRAIRTAADCSLQGEGAQVGGTVYDASVPLLFKIFALVFRA